MNKREDGFKYWCFKGQYKDLEPFIFGSVMLPLDSSMDKILKEGEIAWRKIIPLDMPPSWEPVPGIIIFKNENNA